MSNNTLTVRPGMPVMDISEAGYRRQALVEFTQSIMVKNTDYGIVPGTNGKPTLFKPGAEKLTTFFGLSPHFELIDKEKDWTGAEHGGEPFFYMQYRCDLYHGDVMVGSGVGSCNSWEKKYRYRTVYPNKATDEEKETGRLEKRSGRNGPYQVYVIKNPDPADLVNTIDKMAQKRALVAATLIAVNASEFFTQDIEDMDFGNVIDGDYEDADTRKETSPQAQAKRQKERPAKNGKDPLDQMRGKAHNLGRKLYPDNWDDKRHEIIADMFNATSINDLDESQLSELIAALAEALNKSLT